MKQSHFRAFLKHTTAIASCAVFALQPMVALANPRDGVISAGQAAISEAAKTLTVNQTSDKVVIDWRGFDINADETTLFNQPSSSSIALNRVNSGAASQINGTLTANGNIVIINQNGVMFGSGSRIDVNGLIATTADIGNSAFMNSTGSLTFDKPGDPTASIVNNGSITAGEAGLVGFVAPNVVNNGVITAKMGRVHLASGDTATVDMYGDGLMAVAVSDNVTSQRVTNTGTITANGGTVAMTAAAGQSIVNSLIVSSGTLRAQSVSQHNGVIVIGAAGSNAVAGNVTANKGIKSGSSTVQVSGTVDASGRATGQTGGNVTITGDNITLTGATIDASGDVGGGTIKIGGDFHGQGTTATALTTSVDNGTVISADAITSGNGGDVTVWADGATDYEGTIYARGGALSGNGGYVETSGHDSLLFNGIVDTSAANGETGTLLLDPTDITISNSASTASMTNSSNTYTDTTTTPSNLNVATLQTALASNNIIVSTASALGGNGDITVSDAITWSSAKSLTLTANRDVIINAAISNTTAAGAFSTTGRDITFNANVTTHGTAALSAVATRNLTVANGVTLASGSAMTLEAAGNSVTGTGLLNLNGTLNVGTNGTLTLLSGTDGSGNRNSQTFTSSNLIMNTSFGNVLINGFYDLAINEAIAGNWININAYDNLTVGNVTSNASQYIVLSAANGSASGTGLLTLNGLLSGGTASNGISLVSGADGSSNRNDLTIDGTTIAGLGTGGSLGNLTLNGFRDVTFNENITSTRGIAVTAYRNVTVGNGYTLTTGTSAPFSLVAAGGNIANTGIVTLNGTLNLTSAAVTLTSGLDGSSTAADLTLNSSNFQYNNSNVGSISINGFRDVTVTQDLLSSGTVTIVAGRNLTVGNVTSTLTNRGIVLEAAGNNINNTGILTLNGKITNNSGGGGVNGTVTLVSGLDGSGNRADIAITSSNFSYDPTYTGGLTFKGFNNVSLLTDILNQQFNFLSDNTITLSGNFSTNWISSSSSARLTFTSPVILAGNTTISATDASQTANNQRVSFSSTVDGAYDLTINGSYATFAGMVGGTTPLHNLTVNADNTTFSNKVYGTGALTITPYTTGGTINLNNGTTGLYLSTTEIGYLQNDWANLVFGNSTTGLITAGTATWLSPTTFKSGSDGITISGTETMGANNLTLQTDGTLSFTGGSNSITGTGTLTFLPTTASDTIAVDGTGSTLNITSTDLAAIQSGFAGITIGSTSDTGLMTVSDTTWNAPLTLLGGSGGITLSGVQTMGNNTFLARTASTGDITIGSSGGVTSTSSTANAITLVSAHNFVNNNSSSSTLSDSSSNWLVYSTNPANDTAGGLANDYRRFSCTYGGSCPSLGTGNGFLYSYSPTLTVTPTTQTITYGDNVPALTSYGYSVSGYLGSDSSNDSISGSINGSTNYANGDSIGSYTISKSGGSLTSSMGYTFSYASGTLTVDKAPLIVTAGNKSITYGDADPALTYTYTGLVNSDASANFTGALSRTAGSAVGTYNIQQNTLLATGNYTIGTFNAGTFTISAASGGGSSSSTVTVPSTVQRQSTNGGLNMIGTGWIGYGILSSQSTPSFMDMGTPILFSNNAGANVNGFATPPETILSSGNGGTVNTSNSDLSNGNTGQSKQDKADE